MTHPYYSLFIPTNKSFELDKHFYGARYRTMRCKGCSRSLISLRDPLVVSNAPRDLVLSWIMHTEIGVLRQDLFDALDSSTDEGILKWIDTGLIEKPAGEALTGLIPFQANHKLFIRGTKDVTYYHCPSCDQKSYIGFGENYLLAPVDPAVPFFQAMASQLVVRNDIFESIRHVLPNEMEVEGLNVLESPKDGLPAILYNPVLP